MNDFFARLFGLKAIDLNDPLVRFEFARDWPGWVWVFIVPACAVVAGWSYWKLQGRQGGRVGMGIVRGLFLLLVVLLIAGPQLVKREEREEKDWVVVMADRSASMGVKDADEGGQRVSREEQLRGTLQRHAAVLESLARERNLLYVGFDVGSFDLPVTPVVEGAAPQSPLRLDDPVGRRTAIGRSLDQVARRVAGRPVAGIVLLSDGRTTDPPGKDVLRQLSSRQIPVFPVPLGSPELATDFALASAEGPSAAFVGDIVPVSVRVERRGPDAPGTMVELVDRESGVVLDRRELPAPTSSPARESATGEAAANVDNAPAVSSLTLTASPSRAGVGTWVVRVLPVKPDISPENDTLPLSLELVGRPIRVVYFDGYPRWEYRYLKNLLLRERSIRSSALLLSADKKFIQEGSDPLDVIPRTQQQWQGIDVIVIGDLRPELFSDEQQRQIRELVATRGAGLLWIGGTGSTPNAWRGTPLADLLPFTLGEAGSGSRGNIEPWLSPVVMRPTAAAERLGVMRLSGSGATWPSEISDPASGWSQLRWAQRIERGTLKPTGETIVEGVRADAPGASADALPLVLAMRFGAGRVVYVATDEIWRLRYGRGEEYQERFYIPLLRMLARESVGRSGKPATIEVTPSRAVSERPVVVRVRLLDQSLLERRPPSITVQVVPVGGVPGSRPIELDLKPEGAPSDGSIASVFVGQLVPTDPGKYSVQSADPLLAGLGLSESLEVYLPDDELRDPQTDHPGLAAIANATGGKIISPDQFGTLPSLLPNRSLRVPGTPTIETLWDKPVVWALLILLLSAEWIGRRILKLA